MDVTAYMGSTFLKVEDICNGPYTSARLSLRAGRTPAQ